MERNSFSLSQEISIVIYGAGRSGTELQDILVKNGFRVIAFIDNYTNIESINGVPIIKYDGLSSISDQEVIVIVTVSNLEEHPWIARHISSFGIDKIIYFDLNSLTDDTKNMNSVSKDLMKGIINTREIPLYKKEIIRKRSKDTYCEIISDKRVKALVPVELLFRRKMDSNVSILADEELMFFEYMEGLHDSISQNKIGCEVDFGSRDKRGVYKNLHRNWCKEGLDSCCVSVDFNKQQRLFLVKDSFEFVYFCVAKRYNRIWCEMSKEDFDAWANVDSLQKCWDMIDTEKVSYVYTPIMHYEFYDFPCKREECGDTRLEKICRYIRDNGIDVQGKQVLDVGSYIGYFGQHFARMGSHVTAVEYDKTNFSIAVLLNELLGLTNIEFINAGIQEVDISNKYDIVLMLSILNFYIHDPLGKEILDVIDRISETYLIWESGNEIELEKEFIRSNTGFKSYEKIASTFGTGLRRELGIWRK